VAEYHGLTLAGRLLRLIETATAAASTTLTAIAATATTISGTATAIAADVAALVAWTVTADTAESQIKAAGAFALAVDYSNALDVAGFTYVDVYVTVTAIGTNTAFTLQAQSTGEAVATSWAPVEADDDLANGATTPEPYIASWPLAGATKKQARFQTRGRWMRFGVVGTAADGSYSITAIRGVA